MSADRGRVLSTTRHCVAADTLPLFGDPAIYLCVPGFVLRFTADRATII
jgi:hypothetical protein